MPRVGDREFDYSPAGIAAAQDYATRTGQPMRMAKGKAKKKAGKAKGKAKAKRSTRTTRRAATTGMAGQMPFVPSGMSLPGY